MKRSAVVCVMAASAVNISEGLVARAGPSFIKRRTRNQNQSNTLKMYLDGVDDALLSSSLLTSTAAPIALPSNIFSDASQHIASDPNLEAEILTDVSHVALDLTTFLSINSAWIRFCNVFGRILIITSDYVSDHYISPDEALFQAAMLTVSTQLLVRTAWPVLLAASKTSLSVRDRRAFTQLFSEVDLSVLQFKTLLTSDTLEWVELKQDETLDLNQDYMYWLHSGEVTSSLQESSSNMDDNSSLGIGHRMFGEVHFAKALEESRHHHKTKSAKSNKVRAVTVPSIAVNETLTAGANGAVMLRINTAKLLKLMNHDDQLYDSINGLVLLCMQEKLSRTFHKATEKSHAVYETNFSYTDGKTSVPNVTRV